MTRALRSLVYRSVVEPRSTFPATVNAPAEDAFEVVAEALSRDSIDIAREALWAHVRRGSILEARPTVAAAIHMQARDAVHQLAEMLS